MDFHNGQRKYKYNIYEQRLIKKIINIFWDLKRSIYTDLSRLFLIYLCL